VKVNQPPRPVIIANGRGMKFALVQAGEFQMGSPATDLDAQKSEMPQHRVRISRHYFLGVHPVTVGQFKAFVADTGYQTEAETSGQGGYGFDADSRQIAQRPEDTWRKPGFEQSDDHPVVNVSWHDAVTFCNWLSKKEKQRYRLPTEAEWEYACRAGTTTRFSTGDSADSLKGRANIADRSFKGRFAPDSRWTSEDWDDGFAFTSPVGKFKPNAWGLYDMPGNVWNWCADWYGDDYYASSPAEDPKGPDKGEHRVIRGGCWGRDATYARSACRLTCIPVPRSCKVGFRLLLETAE
jgi:formylglycine-generating enzyme required for sulfatase activity